MKTILISDISGKKDTIIPYALKFTKYIDDSINIIHAVDPRKQHAVSSAYADSQTYEVARKLNHQEILEREKHGAKLALDKLLSKEASKLNFPLRVKTIVEENSIENSLNTEIRKDEPSFIISSLAFEGTIFHDLNEFLEATNKLNNLSLIVPPGYKFSVPQKTFIQYDFEMDLNEGVFKVLDCLKSLNSQVTIVDVAEEKKYKELEIKSIKWKQKAKNYVSEDLAITPHILKGSQYEDTLFNFINANNYDLLVLNKNILASSGLNSYTKAISKKMINRLEVPVILY